LSTKSYRRTPARSAIQALLPGIIEQLQAQLLDGRQAGGVELTHGLFVNGTDSMQALHGLMDCRERIAFIFFVIVQNIFDCPKYSVWGHNVQTKHF
jgi:hypothetical protein